MENMSLFEGNEDINPPFPDKKYPQPPFLQRSVSAPAIAEHVSEAIIPTFNYDQSEEDLGINISYQFPSRLNPRLPQSKKTGQVEENESAYAHLFNDGQKGSMSLLGDGLSDGNTTLPAGLISSLMSDTIKSIVGGENMFDQDTEIKIAAITEESSNFLSQASSKNSTSNNGSDGILPPLMSNPNSGGDDALEQAAKSLQKLYVNPDLIPLSGPNQASTPLLSQFTPLTSNSFFQPGSPVPNANSNSSNSNTTLSLLGNVGQNFSSSGNNESMLPFPLTGGNSNQSNSNESNGNQSSNNTSGFLSSNDNNSSSRIGNNSYGGILGSGNKNSSHHNNNNSGNSNNHGSSNNSHGHVNHGHGGHHGNNNNNSHSGNNQSNNFHHNNSHGNNSNNNSNGGNGNSMNGMMMMPNAMGMMPQLSLMPGNASLQQNAFYMQSMYMNPNGMFFRPMDANGQYSAEYMYPGMMDGSNPLNSLMGADPNQFNLQQMNAFMAQYPGLPSLTGGPGYWPAGAGADQSGSQQGMQMFQRMGNGVDNANNMVFNPNMQYGNLMGPMGAAMGMMPMNQTPPSMPGMIPRSGIGMNGNDGNGFGQDGDGNGNGKDGNRRGGNGDHNNGGRNNDNYNGGYNNGGYNNNYGNNGRNNNRDRNGNNGNGRGSNNHHNNNNGNNYHNGNNNNNNNSNNNGGANNVNNSGSNPVRDPLVEEFRSTFGKTRQWALGDLTSHIVAFCQDQHGSRFIQQKLEVSTDEEKQLVFEEILPAAQTLMTDVFGNYVLQKLFEYGSPEHCEELAALLKGQAVQLSMQMYGCRVVQKALEYVNRDRLVELVAEFENPQLLIRCVHDSNGNHVIQKCIEVVSKVAKEAESQEMSDYFAGKIQFIIDAFNGRVKELSSHPYGCRVVQRILEHCTNPQKSVILDELRACCGELVQDCYGNYVIQFVMQHGWDADRAVLIKEVQDHLLDFSQHKFASNVVEKCLQYANKKDRDEMIWTIINVTFDLNNPVDSKGHCVLESMVRDPYANYVVQKVIDVSDEKQRGAIMRYVKDNINQLRKYTYGKHIIVRLEKITNEKF